MPTIPELFTSERWIMQVKKSGYVIGVHNNCIADATHEMKITFQ